MPPALAACRCAEAARQTVRGDGKVRVSRERAGRGGKTVTVVRGLALDADALAALGKRLRAACGAGGATKDGVLGIQGDHVERVLALLLQEGHAAKSAPAAESPMFAPAYIIRDGLRARPQQARRPVREVGGTMANDEHASTLWQSVRSTACTSRRCATRIGRPSSRAR